MLQPHPADTVNTIDVETDHRGDIALVRVSGDIDATSAALRDALTWSVDHHNGVLVDLSRAGTIDRGGLSVLIQMQDRAHRRATWLYFAELSAPLLSALRELRAESMFAPFESVEAARSWLAKHASVRIAAGATAGL